MHRSKYRGIISKHFALNSKYTVSKLLRIDFKWTVSWDFNWLKLVSIERSWEIHRYETFLTPTELCARRNEKKSGFAAPFKVRFLLWLRVVRGECKFCPVGREMTICCTAYRANRGAQREKLSPNAAHNKSKKALWDRRWSKNFKRIFAHTNLLALKQLSAVVASQFFSFIPNIAL